MENTFIVTPMSQVIHLAPGETYSGSITVANPYDSTDNFNYKVSVSPYSVIGENYDADLTTVSNYSLIKEWTNIKNPKGTLKPNETKDIDFSISVPDSAPAGGQYLALLVSEDTDSIENQGLAVNSVYEIASIVYAGVDGETQRGGEILENNIPGFVLDTPIMTNVLVSNTGNIHETATTVLEVKNIITGEVIFPTNENSRQYSEVVMPETMRRLEYEITNLPVVGVVEVNQSVYYNGTSSIESKNIIICPIWFMILIILILGGVTWGVAHIIRNRIKKHSVI